MNSRIRAINYSLPEKEQLRNITNPNIYTHFGRHIRDREDLKRVLEFRGTIEDLFVPSMRKKSVPGRSARLVHLETDEQILRRHTELGDHRRSQELIIAVERRLTEFDDRLKQKEREESEEGNKDSVLTLEEIATFQKLVGNLIKLKKEHVQTQKGAKIVGAAMEEVVEKIVEAVLLRIAEVAVEIHATLNREIPGSRLADQMSELVRTRVGNDLKTVVPQVVMNVMKKYGIK